MLTPNRIHPCPGCSKPLDYSIPCPGAPPVAPGQLSCCMYCAAALRFTADLGLEFVPLAEIPAAALFSLLAIQTTIFRYWAEKRHTDN